MSYVVIKDKVILKCFHESYFTAAVHEQASADHIKNMIKPAATDHEC